MSEESNQVVKDPEDLEEVDDAEDEDGDDLGDPEEVEAELAAASPDDDESTDDASLEELLAQKAARRTPDERDEEDDDDIMSLSSEAKNPIKEPLPSRVIPIRDRQEFVCNSCHLVKAKSQLADPERLLCRDCV